MPVRSCRSVRATLTCSTAPDSPGPSAPAWSNAAALVRRHTSVSASTRRCPAGRRSRSPVTGFGTGVAIGPIAASSTAACCGVITSWYSVTSPECTSGCDNRATEHRRSCRSSSSPGRPYLASIAGRSRRIWCGPHLVPRSSNASVTVSTAAGTRRGTNRATSPNADNPNDGDTVPACTPAHTTPNGEPGSGAAAASGASEPPPGRRPRPAPRAWPPARHHPDATTAHAPAPTRAGSPRQPPAPPAPPPRSRPPPAPPHPGRPRRRARPSAHPAHHPTPDAPPTPGPPTPPGQPAPPRAAAPVSSPRCPCPHHNRTHVRVTRYPQPHFRASRTVFAHSWAATSQRPGSSPHRAAKPRPTPSTTSRRGPRSSRSGLRNTSPTQERLARSGPDRHADSTKWS